MQIKEFVLDSRARLSALYPEKEAATMVGLICQELLEMETYTYMVNPQLEIKEKNLAYALKAMERLCAGEPLQYVLGYQEFYGRRFNVNPSVLIPRPETEWICRKVIEYGGMLQRKRSAFGSDAQAVRILDLCTGSGCIAWTLAAEIPGSQVVALDISSDAIKTAGSQVIADVEHGREPSFFVADILDDQAVQKALKFQLPFDIIVSNPPYVLDSEKSQMRANVLEHEPELALFVPDDDAQKFNEKIADICVNYSNTDMHGFVEINEALGAAGCEVFSSRGFKNIETLQDFSHKDRLIRFTK